MLTSFNFTIAMNTRGQWVARHEQSGNMALLDLNKGLVVKPGCEPTPELLDAFLWVLGSTLACDTCTEHEGCAPFKA